MLPTKFSHEWLPMVYWVSSFPVLDKLNLVHSCSNNVTIWPSRMRLEIFMVLGNKRIGWRFEHIIGQPFFPYLNGHAFLPVRSGSTLLNNTIGEPECWVSASHFPELARSCCFFYYIHLTASVALIGWILLTVGRACGSSISPICSSGF